MDTYRINNKFNKAEPTNSPVSHSFVAITDNDPVTGRQIVTDTYSWTNEEGGSWHHNYQQDMEGAQAAIDRGIGSWLQGDESLDSYISEQYENRENETGGFWGKKGNCKVQANRLIDDAKNEQKLGREGKKQ